MKKPLLAGVALFLVLVGALVPLLVPWPSRVTRANYERVKAGMTRADVENMLGGPEGDYRNGPTETKPGEVTLVARSGLPRLRLGGDGEWLGDEGTIWVNFSVDGQVMFKAFSEAEPAGGLLETLRWRLNRRWERLWGR